MVIFKLIKCVQDGGSAVLDVWVGFGQESVTGSLTLALFVPPRFHLPVVPPPQTTYHNI